MAFITATPVLLRPTTSFTTSLSARKASVAPHRKAAVMMSEDSPKLEKIPQGFTPFSEQLNGRAAMLGFALAVLTEAITGKGILGQIGSIFDIVNLASALSN